MRYAIILFTITLLALTVTAHAQPDSLWSQTFGGEEIDICNSIIQTADGGYALAGYTRSFGAGEYDMWLVRTNADGDSLWSRTFGGEEVDYCFSIIQTTDGGYALAGFTNDDMWLIKTDENGESRWSRTFGEEGGGWCYSVIQTADGGYALGGWNSSNGDNGVDMWLVKTTANGYTLWSQTFGWVGYDNCYSVIQTADGGYALAGVTSSFGVGEDDMWLVKTDADGDSLWSRTFGGWEDEFCSSIIQTEDGGYALAGRTSSFGAGFYDMWLIKTDADGDSLWSRTFGGESYDVCSSIIQTADGGYALAGCTRSFGAGGRDMWLIRTNTDGDSLWSRTFGGRDTEGCNSMIQTVDGGYALAGATSSFGAGNGDFWLVKTGPDPASAPSESFIPLLPSSFILFPAYPNPFNSVTTIRYGLPYPGNVSLQVYNPFGQRIGTLFEGYRQSGIHTTTMPATNLPSGLYFVRLKASDQMFTQKIMLVR